MYTVFLVFIDFCFNVVINLIQGNPGSVIFASSLGRAICLFVLFPVVGALVFFTIIDKWSNALLITTSILVYVLLPSIIYLLKSNGKSLLGVYGDLHLQFNLYVLIYMPYVLSSVICIVFSNKWKLL
jgi:hypothetical protein